MTNQELATALLVVKASRPREGSGPVNPLLLDQVCNIATAAMETLERVREENEQLKAALSACERFRTEDAQDHILETVDWRRRALYAEQMEKIHKHNAEKFSRALDEERKARYDLGADPEPG